MDNTNTNMCPEGQTAGVESGIRILLAPTLELAKTINPHISVEAEYGDAVVEGSIYTAAHHGSRSANPCPCVDRQIPYLTEGTILVSHLDLDTVGGVGRALGHPACSVRRKLFWQPAAHVDIAGPHKLAAAGASKVDLRRLYAYWAWAQENRGPRRDPAVIHDVTSEVKRHLNVLLDIFGEDDDGALLQAGDAFKAAGEALNAESFRSISGGVITRVSDAFVNHLYVAPTGEVAGAVVAFNTKTKAITLSFAEKDDERNACTIMQKAFGPDAGGHKGIAGSPRGEELEEGDLQRVLAVL